MLIFSTNKEYLLKHFRKDPVLFAYHIADLDDRFFPHCQWGVSHKSYTQIEEAILIYHGTGTPTVLAFGLTNSFRGLLTEICELLPSRCFCHFFAKDRPILEQEFIVEPIGSCFKMKLETFKPTDRKLEAGESVVVLTPEYQEQLVAFYKESFPGNYYDPKMHSTNKYLAVMQGTTLCAVAGVHAISDTNKIAVLGNIATHPDHRGRGYSQIVTSALVELLVKEKKMVALNVRTDNDAARQVYTKLGFVRTHEYEEAILTRR